MAVKVHGRNAALTVTDVGGTVRDISTYLNSIDLSSPVDSVETSSFQQQDKTFLAGMRNNTLRVQGHWSKDANMVDAIFGGLVGQGAAGTIVSTFVYGPGGSASGDVKYTGSFILTNYSRSSPIGGVVTFSADMQISGSMTRTTF